jgi:hypothetical protein
MTSNGSGSVVFRREPRVSRLHDPRKAFSLADVESEIRYDPLTGESSRICHFSLPAAAPSDIAAIAEARRPGCPFCPGRVETVTPRFPDGLVPGGRFLRDAIHGGLRPAAPVPTRPSGASAPKARRCHPGRTAR